MNLRIPNLFKGIANKIFNKKVNDQKASEEKKAELIKHMRMTRGGSKGPNYYNHRKFAYKNLEKMRFGTFTPVKYF